jgi:hypothetical protein
MSMKMAKRVSKSQPNTFYRGSVKIEQLGSIDSPIRGDRTRRSDRSDARPPASGHGITATCHYFERAPPDPNRLTQSHSRVKSRLDTAKDDRTYCAHVRSSRARAPPAYDWTRLSLHLTLCSSRIRSFSESSQSA